MSIVSAMSITLVRMLTPTLLTCSNMSPSQHHSIGAMSHASSRSPRMLTSPGVCAIAHSIYLWGIKDMLTTEYCFHSAHAFFPINIPDALWRIRQDLSALVCVFQCCTLPLWALSTAVLSSSRHQCCTADKPVCRMCVPTTQEGLTWRMMRAHDAHSSQASDWIGIAPL